MAWFGKIKELTGIHSKAQDRHRYAMMAAKPEWDGTEKEVQIMKKC